MLADEQAQLRFTLYAEHPISRVGRAQTETCGDLPRVKTGDFEHGRSLKIAELPVTGLFVAMVPPTTT